METSSTNCKILIIINGEEKDIPENTSIISLLNILKINKNNIVIELNKVIVNKSNYESTELQSNDTIEIVTFVGGG